MREEKREKDKGREKEGQKEGKGKEQSGKDGKSGKKKDRKRQRAKWKKHKFSQLRTIRAVFFIQKSPSHVKRVFFGCEAIFKIPANTLRA